MDNQSDIAPTSEPSALQLDQIFDQVSKDDQDQWEYEYSSTETETFYLTVELSYPEFKGQPVKAYHHSRGGYYKNRQENDSSQETKHKAQASKGAGDYAQTDDDNGDGDNFNPGDDENEGDGTQVDPALRAISKGKESAIDDANSESAREGKGKDTNQDTNDSRGGDEGQILELEDIQILELHSRNPIISYRGRLFEGSWAEVIGTEAILAPRNLSDSLPALRNLPGDIDLLAASSSRILTLEKLPKLNFPEQDTLAQIKKEWNIKIPTGKDRTGERTEQITFLENLIALKMKRGDKDQVTVYVTDGVGKDWDDGKALNFKPRRKKTTSIRAPGEGSCEQSREARGD